MGYGSRARVLQTMGAGWEAEHARQINEWVDEEARSPTTRLPTQKIDRVAQYVEVCEPPPLCSTRQLPHKYEY